jgi:hypothetical protein
MKRWEGPCYPISKWPLLEETLLILVFVGCALQAGQRESQVVERMVRASIQLLHFSLSMITDYIVS